MNAYKQDDQRSGIGDAAWRPDAARHTTAPVRAKNSWRTSANTALHSSRRVRLLTALVLIALCGLAVPVLVTLLTPKPAKALQTTIDLPAGTVITAADLRTVNATGPTSAVVPAAEQPSIIGQTVKVEVPAGALLDPADLGPFPPIGSSLVPVAVKPGQYPSNLQTGESVAVFPVSTGTAAGSVSEAAHAAATGTVIRISPAASDGSGQVVIDLEVATPAAPVVAQAPAVVLVGLDSRADTP